MPEDWSRGRLRVPTPYALTVAHQYWAFCLIVMRLVVADPGRDSKRPNWSVFSMPAIAISGEPVPPMKGVLYLTTRLPTAALRA